MRLLPVVDGWKYCAFHDTAYSFMDLRRPNTDLKCTDPEFPKACGSGNRDQMYCIPEKSRCPLTKVWFSANGTDFLATDDPAEGSPLIDINLSEEYAPCVDSFNHFSALPNKERTMVFSDLYSTDCPAISVGGDEFRHSRLFRRVESFRNVSEYTLLKENEKNTRTFGTKMAYDLVKILPSYDEEVLKLYNFSMYEKTNINLEEGCSYVNTTGKNVTLRTREVPGVVSEVHHQVYWVYFIYYFMWVVIWIQVFEYAMVFMHNNDALDASTFNKMYTVKKCMGLVCSFVCLYCIRGVFQWNGKNLHVHTKVTALAESHCTSDVIMADIFS
jgi:hypothetical protein